jgi:voltage-gated potassium channel
MFFRDRFGFYLDDFQTRIGQVVNLFILGLIFISAGIFVAETFVLSEEVSFFLNKVDQLILVLFTIEYLLRVWMSESKLRFIFSLFSLLDLMAILPLLLGWLDLRFLPLLRVFRILRIIRFLDFEIFIFKIEQKDGVILIRIFLTLFIYQFEHSENPQVFRNFYDAFYFSIVTMTTVGFGDLAPISEEGRLVTLIMILTGVTIIPWQLGELIKQLVKNNSKISAKICSNCHLSNHDSDAIYCKICGEKLTTNC